MSLIEKLQHNLQMIVGDIEVACARSGRNAADVKLVAVTKYATWADVQELSRLYQIFGENRPQQLAERQLLLPDVQWHLIGQLQRNKVRLALQHAALIHSVDSLKLLERIAEVGADLHQRPRVLLQLNLSGESSKSGFTFDEIKSIWSDVLKLSDQVRIDGLMTMAAESENPEDARPCFRTLRECRDELASRPETAAAGLTLQELSMGMSGDFIQAVEEGATLIRIGSRVFA
ncbi:MAG: YggS family pyridoxal phosphate-dependent enzyme [Planctomycetota bacterium]|nr:MAG: YggS family pyridoxal phosphate-dependent enzyme [Planctomycetota bacterium]